MIQSKHTTVQRYFENISGKYDLINTLLSMGLHFSWKRHAVRHAGIKTGDRVLDLCGGTADLALQAAPAAGESGLVTVYDFSFAMLRAGLGKKGRNTHGAALTYLCGDAQQLALKSESFDAVLIGFGLRNLADMCRGLSEIHRVLKPGGTLLCLEFSRPVNPVFRYLYNLYSRTVIPLTGSVLAGSRDAYAYLPDSIRSFPLPDALCDMMQKTGFDPIEYTMLTNGIAVSYRATKSSIQFC
jgi:demethylmenaquinone methyltransferase/2-methoxy-6-polyprenyl-1,4-benzoquinol methylase